MTARQRAGSPLGEVRAPFHGFQVGPISVARARTVEQLLNAAVRTVTVFGSADEMIEEDEPEAAPRHTLRTAAFLGQVKRLLVESDESMRGRFDKRLRLPGQAPEVTIDYAFERWLVQVTSLPISARQTVNVQREAQSKLLELEIACRAMDGNAVSPVLLVNEDALQFAQAGEAEQVARHMQERLSQLARSCGTLLLQAADAEQGSLLLYGLSGARRARAVA